MLEAMEKTISMAQLAKHSERIAADIETAGTVYRIKRPGRKQLLLVDNTYFERWAATMEFIAQHPNWEAELAQAEKDYRDGRYIPLEVVLKELGLEDVATKPARRKTARRSATARRSKAR